MTDPVIIKKYANRRLYDTEQSAYVTLEQVAGRIRAGRTIKVIDAASGEDVTGFILNQIILEASKKQAMLPVSLLHLIIRYGDNLLSDFFEKYLEETLKIYVHSKKTFDSYFRQWLRMGMRVSGMPHRDESEINPDDMDGIPDMFAMLNSTQDEPAPPEEADEPEEYAASHKVRKGTK